MKRLPLILSFSAAFLLLFSCEGPLGLDGNVVKTYEQAMKISEGLIWEYEVTQVNYNGSLKKKPFRQKIIVLQNHYINGLNWYRVNNPFNSKMVELWTMRKEGFFTWYNDGYEKPFLAYPYPAKIGQTVSIPSPGLNYKVERRVVSTNFSCAIKGNYYNAVIYHDDILDKKGNILFPKKEVSYFVLGIGIVRKEIYDYDITRDNIILIETRDLIR